MGIIRDLWNAGAPWGTEVFKNWAEAVNSRVDDPLIFERTTEYSVNQGSAPSRTLFPEGSNNGVFVPTSDTVTLELEMSAYGAGIAHFAPFIIYSQALDPPLRPLTPLYLGHSPDLKWEHLGVIRGQATHYFKRKLTGLTPGLPCNFEVFGGIVGYSHSTHPDMSWPWDLAVSPVSRHMYVSEYTGNKVRKFELPHTIPDVTRRGVADTDVEVGVITVEGATGLAVSRDGSKIAVAKAGGGVAVAQTKNFGQAPIEDDIPVPGVSGPTSVQWGADGRYLYVANSTGQIRQLDSQNDYAEGWLINASGLTNMGEIRLSPSGHALAFMGNKRYAYAARVSDGEFIAYRDFGSAGAAPENVVVWDVGSRYLWAAGRGGVVNRLDTQSAIPTTITHSSVPLGGPIRALAIDSHGGSVAAALHPANPNRLVFFTASLDVPHLMGQLWEKTTSFPPQEPIRIRATPDHADYIILTANGIYTLDGAVLTMRPEDKFWAERAVLRIYGAQAPA